MDMKTIDKKYKWSKWLPFPNPIQCDYLHAPFGWGVYHLRKGEKYVLFGSSKNLASRMCSLLPLPSGQGGRKNEAKRKYVLENIKSIDYRTVACKTKEEALQIERELRSLKIHCFNT